MFKLKIILSHKIYLINLFNNIYNKEKMREENMS